jgi:hypothetical protein
MIIRRIMDKCLNEFQENKNKQLNGRKTIQDMKEKFNEVIEKSQIEILVM